MLLPSPRPCPHDDGSDSEDRGERLSALRGLLARQFPAAMLAWETPGEVMPTGVVTLDRLLPGGGLPRGRVTEWVCAHSGGSATLLHALLLGALERGDAVALVDAGRTLAASDWVEAAQRGALTVVRPHEPGDALFCAELLLRTRLFALVALDGLPVPQGFAPRLVHLVQEAGCVFLVIRPEICRPRQVVGPGPGSLRLALAPLPPAQPSAQTGLERPCEIRASIVKGAPLGHTEIRCVVPTPNRLCAHSLVPDRRGGARHGRSW